MDYKTIYKELFDLYLINFNRERLESRLSEIFKNGIDKSNKDEHYLKIVQIKKSYEARGK